MHHCQRLPEFLASSNTKNVKIGVLPFAASLEAFHNVSSQPLQGWFKGARIICTLYRYECENHSHYSMGHVHSSSLASTDVPSRTERQYLKASTVFVTQSWQKMDLGLFLIKSLKSLIQLLLSIICFVSIYLFSASLFWLCALVSIWLVLLLWFVIRAATRGQGTDRRTIIDSYYNWPVGEDVWYVDIGVRTSLPNRC